VINRMADGAAIGFIVGRHQQRVPGTAVHDYVDDRRAPCASPQSQDNKVLHARVMLLTVRIEDVPFVAGERRIETKEYGAGFFRIILRYGFMEEIDVPTALGQVTMCGPQFKMMDTSFFWPARR
jgi:KUP system potassium uptake protein